MMREGVILRLDDNSDGFGRLFRLSLLYGIDLLFTTNVEYPTWTASGTKRGIVVSFNSEFSRWLESRQPVYTYLKMMEAFERNKQLVQSLVREVKSFEVKVATFLEKIKVTDVVEPIAIQDLGKFEYALRVTCLEYCV